MPDGRDAVAIRIVDRLSSVPAAEWDACLAGTGQPYNPFLSHRFLAALEESGSVSARSGWQPQHLVIENSAGQLIGAAPLYLKSHSQGEYVFDHAWAHAYERAGGDYYPKLQCAVPFTPVTGARLLYNSDAETDGLSATGIQSALAGGLAEITRQLSVSSLHVTFCSEEDADFLESADFLIRHGHQFHWHNEGYEDFDGFLASLNSRKRKNIRKERRKVAESGIRVRGLQGGDIKPEHWDAFYRFYIDTYDRKWGYPYLTRDFFTALQESMADDVVLFMADLDGQLIAGALNLRGEDALFGRNWGCDIRFKFLHFETCYYNAMDYAIKHGIRRVEAGTQGPHKLQRGYVPVRTYSAHWIQDGGFRRAVADYLTGERQAEAHEMVEFEDYLPYRQDPSQSG